MPLRRPLFREIQEGIFREIECEDVLSPLSLDNCGVKGTRKF